MKRTIKIGGGINEGVINTGAFANLRPAFPLEEIYSDVDFTDKEIKNRALELYDISRSLFDMVKSSEEIKRIEIERKDLRFLPDPETGIIVPSSTSVIGWDADFFVLAIELSQYAAQSTIVHEKVAYYIETGQWVKAKDLQDIWAEIVIVTKGNLKLELETGDFPGFLKKYPITEMKNCIRLFNKIDLYCGLPDFEGIPDFKGAEKVRSVFDVKRTPDKIKDGMQLASYAKMLGVKQGIIVPLNAKTEQNYSKPQVYDKKTLEGYYKLFLRKRSDFKKRYQI